MHKLLFILAFLLAAYGISRAQNFNYTISTDSVAWNELSSQTILNTSNSAWVFAYKIPIGFTFPFCGRNFDSLTIETNGYLVFDADRRYAMTMFSGVDDHVDENGTHAVLGYELSGTVGNHILKIQYLHCSPYAGGNEVLSWQIWLRESGNAEVRVGPGTLRCDTVMMAGVSEITLMDTMYPVVEMDTLQRYRIGLLNMNMDTEECGYFIGDNPASPQAQLVDVNHPEILILDMVPARGYRYTFTPSN